MQDAWSDTRNQFIQFLDSLCFSKEVYFFLPGFDSVCSIYSFNEKECFDDHKASYAICSLEFDDEKEQYVYRGRLFSNDLDPYTSQFVSFKSRCLTYDKSDIIYVSDAVTLSINGVPKSVAACGIMKKQDDNPFTGKFNDLYFGGSESLFKMRKIDSDIMKSFNSYMNTDKKTKITISDLENTHHALKFIEWFKDNRAKYI